MKDFKGADVDDLKKRKSKITVYCPRSVNESLPVLMVLRALLQDHMHTHVAAHAAGGGEGEGGATKSAA
ncbi:hypothetical protein MSG28_012584 [Choristoneura fumiferana]|uniref:Uncharacterized protein n=1 Tax=Choristoneura fumiferana TaxID=7141 RepID=A0ACC0JH82_CHOFU|nr:hypothetical protein MSG28_012584 [Choristoneura fumiferana]